MNRATALFAFLIALGPHGRADAQAQSRAQQGGLASLAQSSMQGPVVVIDLVKFNSGGEEGYDKYDAIAEAKLNSLGGEVIFRGSSTSVPGMNSTQWDRVTFRKYPSAAAVLEMGASAEYRSGFPHRLASVVKSFVYAFSSRAPSGGNSGDSTSDAMKIAPPAPTTESVYMLNLLRFKPEGGIEDYFGRYGAAVAPLMGEHKGHVVFRFTGVAPVIAEETIDQLILVSYPSPSAFRAMVDSEAYRKVAHLRTDSIELGLIWPFSNDR